MANQNKFTQLTTPGLTAGYNTGESVSHTYQVTVASINTNVTIQALGSADGVSYGTLTLNNSAVAGLSVSNNQATITANGTYLLRCVNQPIAATKFQFVSESGGTTATLDVVYMGE